MGRPTRIDGFAIISEDGMLADPNGHMPDGIKFEADLKFFTEGMDGCDVAIHGRHSHERQPNSPKRHRIWVTGRVRTVEREDSEPRVLLWNPEGASFEQAWDALGVNGSLGVVGGTTVFDLFLPLYDVFYLTHAPGLRLPGGRPVFSEVPAKTPESILSRHGMKPDAPIMLDAAKNLKMVAWRR